MTGTNQTKAGTGLAATAADGRFFAACEAYHRRFGTEPFYAYGVAQETMTGYLERAVASGVADFNPHDWLPPDALA